MRISRGNWYQLSLIFLGMLVTALFGVFFMRELFPEYKKYQNIYVELEKFRSTYTGERPPPFESEIKQIMVEKEGGGIPTIDRCVSCHVTLQFSHFSPTKVARDENGKVMYDAEGKPEQVPNEDYVWDRLDARIKELEEHGLTGQAEHLKELKTVEVGEYIYDVTKVLRAHPLIGKETRPFEYHPIDEYGCTVCHGGNGRGLVTDRAHGPVVDGQYEEEFMGPEPEFLEPDSENDPRFSKMFNHKPGHRLLFQTTPILLGSLIEAKCVQCHAVNSSRIFEESSEVSMLDSSPLINQLTENFQRGQELFLSQACYACHRIAGFSRGGVGMELTNSGITYPWYLKESIVWPQADLKTSTMPNFHLDHHELEDLMTYLLAQHGRGKIKSETQYKKELLEWDAGKKLPWEQPINPGNLHDLDYSMTVFAEEGCAACHRLKGFSSNVGYAVEKGQNVPFGTLYKEKEWFQKLFPEEIIGSEIVKAIEENSQEIDARIIDDVRSNSLLEKLEETNPGLVDSFYSNFRYAYRGKNAYYEKLAEENSAQKAKYMDELDAWHKRVNRVLKMYVQEYGLGRLIGPRPNWSGIYRSDEWLIEHFRKPSRHTARSIMPVMPFDDSKYYALTYMLDELAKRNRDEVRQIWEHKGFDPELAYHIHCAQCHGQFLHGNGPVSEWIYPIPKNLRDAVFLRNYTKENIIYSITHGVKGTPMPPWGEVAADKPMADGTPVLKESEIEQIVDWLFSSLLGGTIIRSEKDVPKWQYGPEDILEELEKEKNVLIPGPPPKTLQFEEYKPENGAYIPPNADQYYAALNPQPMRKRNIAELDVSDVFDVYPNPERGIEDKLYYIKKKYYTKENITQGQQFFELNCAVCHGKEADGMGFRAGTMYDAKPRMLTNLHWIDSRDDLRLIRSIKFGVQGTSMTPWGDLTSSLQRLQLVMYIRSLSTEQQQRDDLFDVLYRVFDRSDQNLDTARIREYRIVNEIQSELDNTIAMRANLVQKIEEGTAQPEEGVNLYKKELELAKKLKQHKEADQLLLDLKKLVKKEGQVYQNLGVMLLGKDPLGEIIAKYLKALSVDNSQYTITNGTLFVAFDLSKEAEIDTLGREIMKTLDQHIKRMKKEKVIVQGKLPSEERTKELDQLNATLQSFEKLKNEMNSSFEETKQLRREQKQLYEAYLKKIEQLYPISLKIRDFGFEKAKIPNLEANRV